MITLAALFWTTQPTNALADVKRIYIVAKKNLTLKEILDAFGTGATRSLKQCLKDDPMISYCDDNFSDYQELYRKLLYMDNRNAPALLARALGLKKIDDLTDLIRGLVLEPSTVKEDAKKVVDEFSDLVAIHNQLLDAKAQQEHLSRLPDLATAIKHAEHTLAELCSERAGLPIYFGEICAQLWQQKITRYKETLDHLIMQIKNTAEKEHDTSELAERRHEEYLQFGGDKIESLKKDLSHTQNTLSRIVKESSRYQEDARSLALNSDLDENQFSANQTLAADKLNSINNDTRESQDKFAAISAQFSEVQSKKNDITHEITEIETRPDSNIDLKFQQLRDELVQSLELRHKQCIFIGELIDVREEQRSWQGAIERALGGLRTTLAVPNNCYSMVTKWLNVRHTGLHVRVQVVNDSYKTKKNKQAEFKANGFLRKLVWRDHPYREWLKHHLSRFDLQCVSSTEELDRTPFSITQQGLMHMDTGRFEKKDKYRIDERRHWCLGFSNKSRLAILNKERNDLIQQLAATEKLVKKARDDWDTLAQRKSLWEKLQSYRWDDINAPYWQAKSSQLNTDLKALEQSGSDLDMAKIRWQDAKNDLAVIRSEKEKLIRKQGELSTTLADAETAHRKACTTASVGLDDAVRKLLETRVGSITANDLDQINNTLNQHDKDIEQSLELWRSKKSSAEKSAIGIMSSFRSHEKWQVFANDWHSDIASLQEYLKHLRQLQQEGLPDLVEQFIERLNKHATQSLVGIKTKLESERENIIERIEIINQVLRRTEFKPGSYLRLGSRKEKFPHVQAFEQHLRTALSQITSNDHEDRFKQLAQVVEILEKASNSATATTLESLRLLDPRYQMSFYAEELDADTSEVHDVLASSSGKSGGEKESFAGTIVAASLAYVLTPDGYERPIYSTVFLDEAFANTAEATSRRVLRVFKALHIHVNLITPYKNLNLARESARSLLIVERDQANHDSHLCEVTWEEIDRRMAEQSEQKLVKQTSLLGVDLDNVDTDAHINKIPDEATLG